jgi:metal-dependent amidase/aminoacylase/carboxypeptidase family protein
MTMVAGAAAALTRRPPRSGRYVALFQPSEETGAGATRVLSDARYQALAPDLVFALHNLPGYPLGTIVSRSGVFACASTGLIIELEGRTSHAAEPHRGASPALALAQLIQAFSAAPQTGTALHESSKVTVIHARLGEVAFGTSPGRAALMTTLRAAADAVIARLDAHCEKLATDIAAAYNLRASVGRTEEFLATVNAPEAVAVVEDAARHLGLELERPEHPFPWSEDFGRFTQQTPGALFGLGAGTAQPALHNPEYDFPDALIPTGVDLLAAVVRGAMEE